MNSATKINVNTCRICSNSRDNIHFTAKEMMIGTRDKFLYFQCKNCQCLQISEFPEDMSKYYQPNYYSFSLNNRNISMVFFDKLRRIKYYLLLTNSTLLRNIVKFFFISNRFWIFEKLDINKRANILDVGCGNGKNFLYKLAEIGFENVHGCDPFLETPLTYDNGLQISKSDVFNIEGSWDIITYHHSFEHIPNPLEQLKKVYELLKPDGVCIIRIPTVSSFAWEHYKLNWVQLDAPRHFFLHSTKSMRMLGEISNLELYETIFDSNQFQFSGSEKYLQGIALSSPKPKGILNFTKRKIKQIQYRRKSKLLNKERIGDQAAFFFRKSSVNNK